MQTVFEVLFVLAFVLPPAAVVLGAAVLALTSTGASRTAAVDRRPQDAVAH